MKLRRAGTFPFLSRLPRKKQVDIVFPKNSKGIRALNSKLKEAWKSSRSKERHISYVLVLLVLFIYQQFDFQVTTFVMFLKTFL